MRGTKIVLCRGFWDVKAKMARLLLGFVFVMCSGCAGPIKDLYPPKEGEPSKPIYVVSHGWHAGVVIRLEDVPANVWPESQDFIGAKYLEVGWGDQAFYQTPEPGIGHVLKAVVWPTASVLHIVAFDEPVESFFPTSEIIRVDVSEAGFENLSHYIHESYAKDDAGNTVDQGSGLYGYSKFYLSQEKYHLFKTCNVWTAKGIRSTGYPISSFYALTVDNLMSQVGKHGKAIRARREQP